MRRPAAAICLVLALGACAAGTDPTGSPSPPVTPSPTEGRAIALGPPGQALEPGRYTREGFQPRVSFEVGTGWTAEQSLPGFFDVQLGAGTLDVIAVQFARPLSFADSATTTVQTGSADEAIQALRANPQLVASEAEPVTVDGVEGVRVDVETSDPIETQPPILRPVLTVAAGPISIASARRLRVTLLETPDGLLAILVGGSINAWAETLETATPVVESVHIGE